MLFVILSAYKIAIPLTCLAALPIVCVNDLWDLRKPSLSASKIATNETSGKSRPSLSKLTPINTSNLSSLKPCIISTLSIVSTSEWIYLDLTSILVKKDESSSAIFFVKVVTKIFSFLSTLFWISSIKSSIWCLVGLISISGSNRPVGLIICSVIIPSLISNS